MSEVRPFHLDVPDSTLDQFRERVASFPWHEMPDDGGWEYGTNLDYMKDLCAYWVEEYDWGKHEARINQFSHHRATIDGMALFPAEMLAWPPRSYVERIYNVAQWSEMPRG